MSSYGGYVSSLLHVVFGWLVIIGLFIMGGIAYQAKVSVWAGFGCAIVVWWGIFCVYAAMWPDMKKVWVAIKGIK